MVPCTTPCRLERMIIEHNPEAVSNPTRIFKVQTDPLLAKMMPRLYLIFPATQAISLLES
jgi:hypothetical protein